ncbi:hypothetical protein HQS1_08110 [Delftia lacustris]|nr:hypothetical protein HQS1_08110 [Delftia lacustris]
MALGGEVSAERGTEGGTEGARFYTGPGFAILRANSRMEIRLAARTHARTKETQHGR